MNDTIRQRIALFLRRLARRIDHGCIQRIEGEILPDDVYFIFRGVDPENPTDETIPMSGCDVVVKVVGDD